MQLGIFRDFNLGNRTAKPKLPDIFQIATSWERDTNKKQVIFRLRSHDQSFSKVSIFSEHEADTVSVFKSLRFHYKFQPGHTTPTLLRFQIFPLWRSFSKVYVSIENDTSFSSFSCGRDMKTQQNATNFCRARALIGYSSSGYPALSTGLQNTMDARASNHLSSRVLTREYSFFIASYSLVWYILIQLFPGLQNTMG